MEIMRGENPISFFQNWLSEASKTEINDPEAMSLATVGANGQPSVRMVLMKGVDEKGFRFFTNTESRKAGELMLAGRAGLCFHWKSLLRQVRVEGKIEELSRLEVENYFATRHPLSKAGAWASKQSQPLESRAELVARVKEVQEKFGDHIPTPPHWGGYIVVPDKIEFWQQGDGRLHDRFLFERTYGGWKVERLNP